MKLNRFLLIISIILVAIGGVCFIVGSVFSFTSQPTIGDILWAASSILGLIALALLIVRLVLMSKTPELYRTEQPKVVVKVVDRNEFIKTKEQELYEQYEDLYKRNLISKEELDQKRVELLGK